MNSQLQHDALPTMGFTLIELVVTLAIAGILLGIGVPSLRGAIQDAKLSQVIDPVRLAFHTARSEAVKGANQVTVCPLASELVCGDDWTQGLMVFIDRRVVFDEVVAVRDVDDVVLRLEEAIEGDLTREVFASDDRTAGGLYSPAFIRFGSNGQSNWLNGSVIACDDRGAELARSLDVTLSGDIQSGRRFNGVLEDVFGRPVSCP